MLAHYNLSTLYSKQRNWEKVVHHAQVFLDNVPTDIQAREDLAYALMCLSEYKSALQHLVVLTSIDPKHLEAYVWMSGAYAELGLHALAIGAAQEALRIDPDSWMAYMDWGHALSHGGEYEPAIEMSLKSLDLGPPPEPAYRITLDIALWYAKSGQLAKAREYLEQASALEIDPDARCDFKKGFVYLALGEAAEAEGIYEQGMGKASEREYNRDALEAIRDIDELVAPAAAAGSNEAGIGDVAARIRSRLQRSLGNEPDGEETSGFDV